MYGYGYIPHTRSLDHMAFSLHEQTNFGSGMVIYRSFVMLMFCRSECETGCQRIFYGKYPFCWTIIWIWSKKKWKIFEKMLTLKNTTCAWSLRVFTKKQLKNSMKWWPNIWITISDVLSSKPVIRTDNRTLHAHFYIISCGLLRHLRDKKVFVCTKKYTTQE